MASAGLDRRVYRLQFLPRHIDRLSAPVDSLDPARFKIYPLWVVRSIRAPLSPLSSNSDFRTKLIEAVGELAGHSWCW